MALADVIKEARKNSGLTLRDVARKTEISLTLLCAIETGKRPRPKMEILSRLSAFYNISNDVVCIAATRIPQKEFYKVIRCPALLEVIRNYPE